MTRRRWCEPVPGSGPRPVKAGPDVGFDFEAAPALARRLHALADQLAAVGAGRQRGAEVASVGFQGG